VFQQATATSNKLLLVSRPKWVKVHSNTSHVHGLVEAMRSPEVSAMLQGTKFAREGLMLDKLVTRMEFHLALGELTWIGCRFHKMMATDELRAWYGPDHVALAVDRGAVGTLLISDELFR
jgi:protein pelota